MVTIIPAILPTTEEEYKKLAEKLNSAESLEEGWVHIDFADNKFVQNQTVSPDVVAKTPINLSKEAHLMVENPVDMLDPLIEAGFGRIILHAESEKVKENLEYIKGKNIESGLALLINTDLTDFTELLKTIDVLLFMSIEAGFQGQPFIPYSLVKIKKAAEFREKNGLNFKIEVDGAVSIENIKQLITAGCDNLVVGSHLIEGDINENLETLWEEINS